MSYDVPQASTPAGIGKLIELVRAIHLTPTQRTIVRTMVTQGDRATYLTATELAELARVSQPSVTRLAVALGFEGYPQLRRVLREAAPQDVIRSSGPVNEWQRSMDFEIAAAQQVRDELANEDLVRSAARLLAGGRTLLVAGHRSARPVADYVGYFAGRMVDDVRIVPDASGAPDVDVLVRAHAAGARSLLAIVLPRYGEESLELMRRARDLDMRVVCVTDSVVSPAADLADQLLVAPVDSSLLFDSPAVPFMVVNVLLAAMSEVDPSATQARLERFDDLARSDGLAQDRRRAAT